MILFKYSNNWFSIEAKLRKRASYAKYEAKYNARGNPE